MTWDFQGEKWQVMFMKWEDELATGDGMSKDGKWQVMTWEDEFTTGDGTSNMGSGRS